MVEKFTGTGFSANALLLDFLRDQDGNPLQTPNSLSVLHNPVRQKINDVIDALASQPFDLENINGQLFYKGFPVGCTAIDGGDELLYSGTEVLFDGGDETTPTGLTFDGGNHR